MSDALNNLISNNVIKNITQEVIRECIKYDVIIKDNYALFLINLLSLNPTNGINLDDRFERYNVERFVNYCVQILIDEQRPFLKTMYMQITYLQNVINSEQIIEKQTNLLTMKTDLLTKKIIECDALTKEEREKLFKKIVIDIIVNNGLGSPANPNVIRETTNALRSVMNQSDITAFLELKSKERLISLKELRSVVCGIRIFNKDAGHCGEGIINLPEILAKNYESTNTILSITLNEINDKITKLTNTLINVVNYNELDCELNITLHINDNDSNENKENKYNYLKELLTMYRQHEIYLKKLLENLNNTNGNIEKFSKIYREQLDDLHGSVQFKIAIPCELIFPKFTNLSETWLRLQNKIYILAEINKLNNKLMKITESVSNYDKLLEEINKSAEKDTKKELKNQNKFLNIHNREFKLIRKKRDNYKLQYQGFCPKLIKSGKGLLIPGDINCGLCDYKRKYFSFFKWNYIDCFNKNPEGLIYDIMETARYHPELIFLLDIYDEIKLNITHPKSDGVVKDVATPSQDNEIQTEVHPIPYKYDKDYTSNIWDLRRRAIQLANIRKCLTKSAQTAATYQRYGIKIQTISTKDQNDQTKRDSYTNVPQPSNYLRFVRGVPTDTKTELTNLTRSVDEDHTVTSTINCSTPIKDYFTKPHVLHPIGGKKRK